MKAYVVISGVDFVPSVIYAGTDKEKALQIAGADVSDSPHQWHIEDNRANDEGEIYFAQKNEGDMEDYTSVQAVDLQVQAP
jgi:hypothetical protein